MTVKASLLTAAAIVLVVAAYLLFFKTASTPAFTEKDTLVVADFVNTTSDPVFDDALKQAVTVQLQQTPYLTLLSDQRVQRALQFMQRPPGEAVTGAVSRELCQRSGAKATVEGSIAPLGSSYVIALGVYNCQTGDPLAQQQVQARSKEDVLTALGGAVKDLRQHLGESLATIQKYDVPLTEATTRSLEALRAYALANKTRATRGDEAAIPFYQQALRHDPTFALAYAKLGVVSANIGRSADARQFALKAYELRDKVSEYERLYILWNHATRVLEDPKAAYDTLVLMTTSYPRDYAAHNNLGVYYMGRGQFEEALAQYRAATDIAPDEALPLSNAAYALAFLGRLDEADQVAQRAQALRPTPGLAVTLWSAAVRTNHPRAKALEDAARRVAPPRAIASVEASLALWRGKLADYAKFQDALRAQARAAHDEAWLAQVDSDERMMRAAYLGGPNVDRVKASLGPGTPPALVAQGVVLLAALGDLAPARAALPRLEAAGKTESDVRIGASIARSYIRAADGQPNEAVADLQATLNEFPRALELHFPIGVIRERAGDLKGAATAYRSVLAAMPVLGLSPLVSLTRFRLAGVLAKDGDAAGAREQLDALLEQWKDADAEFDLLKQAKAARAAIK